MPARPLLAQMPLLAACLLAIVAGCRSGGAASTGHVPAPSHAVGVVASNVARGDYVGSAVCASCHADEAASWARSPMHRMTRDARGADIRAPFDGTRWSFKDDVVTLESHGGDRFVHVDSATGGPGVVYRVTRVIGGRAREDFAGIDVAAGHEEVVLPVSFVYATHALRYKGYSVMVHERATLRAGPVWSRTCIFCHNTIPEMDRLLGALSGAKARGYQGELVDPWLPEPSRARWHVADRAGFARVAEQEIARLGGVEPGSGDDAHAIARRAVDVIRAGFDGGALVEEGIGCEACHGGAAEHARDPRVRPTFVPSAPWLDGAPAPSSAAQAVTRACARCHQVLFSRYPFTWEGGRRDRAAGGSHISSGEARDFLLGGCASAMSCTACHDPHGADDAAKLRALATPSGNATCTPCHAELAAPERLRAHAHHDPAGAGASCVACHMPRKNMGLDGKLTRYHRIGSPTDPARVLGDRPLECALCHADASVRKLADTMEAWWPVRYPRQLYGSLDANVLRATLELGRAHEQAVAIGVLGEAHARDAAPLIARQLANEYPLVREWAKNALDEMGVAAPSPAAAPGADEDPED
jgi:predicted CXXCH cytochrome family protein